MVLFFHGDGDHGYFMDSKEAVILVANAIADIKSTPVFGVNRKDLVEVYCRSEEGVANDKSKLP
jgi:hypothetical protein